MKKSALTFLLFSFFLLSADVLFSQSRFVIKDNAYIVLNTASTTDEVFVVLDNENTIALDISSAGGKIITKHEKNQIKWNIGANTHHFFINGTNNEISVNTSTPASTIDIQGSMGLSNYDHICHYIGSSP